MDAIHRILKSVDFFVGMKTKHRNKQYVKENPQVKLVVFLKRIVRYHLSGV